MKEDADARIMVTPVDGPSIFQTPLDTFFECVFYPPVEGGDGFDEVFLARTIRRIAGDLAPQDREASLARNALEVIADALDNPLANVRLKIARRRRGGPVSFRQQQQLDASYEAIARVVWEHGGRFGQIEAGVNEACRVHKVSKPTVYKALRRMAEIVRVWRKMDEGIDPTSRRNKAWLALRAAETEFENWVDRYSFEKRKP